MAMERMGNDSFSSQNMKVTTAQQEKEEDEEAKTSFDCADSALIL